MQKISQKMGGLEFFKKDDKLIMGELKVPPKLTWSMTKRLKLVGITYLVGKIKFKLFFSFSGSIG